MVLVICHPTADADTEAVARLLPKETEALRRLRQSGILTNAWSPGRPGAVLLLETDAGKAEKLIRALPLAQAGLLDFEITPLLPLPL